MALRALVAANHAYFNITTAITNKNNVANWTDNKLGIVGYLDDAEVVRQSHQALAHSR